MSGNKEKPEGTEIRYGTCKYCGQINRMDTVGQCTEKQLNDWATEMCDCSGARVEKKRAETAEKARSNIEKLFRENYPDTADILRMAVGPVTKNIIAGITVDTGHGIKGKVTLTSKGKVKVEQIVSRKTSLEE